ncbi:TonB-dependent receptor [Sphingomonas paeninsulae]|uniref:TonB-dependent receptor n=1 Tax=Sphingomonas paeninsulae TaxID=2319844 RepID=A0A494TFE8_SPHPE|nr:TonB-dependent receptor [Sphingomonas paeninsulae]
MQRKNSVIRFKYAVAAIALLPVSAFAEDANTASDSNIVVTATGAAEEADQSGQAITVLDKATIDARQYQAVSDLLSTTPGVTVTRNGGIGQPTAVRIRGAEDTQTLVLIDGVRVNDPTSPGGAFDFGNLLTGNIDHIEVLRGPNSVPWGSQALGGVVNIVTAPIPDALGGSLRAEYGYKNSKQVVGQLGGKSGIFSASLGGGYFDDDGISAFKGGTERDGYRQYAANGRVGVAFSDTINLDLRANYADSRVDYDGYQSTFPYSFTDTADYAKTQQIFGYAGLNVALFDGALKNRLAFTINDTHRDNFEPAFGSAPSFVARGRVERYEYQGDATITDAVRAVFGLEHENSRFFDGFSTERTNLESGYLQAILKPIESLTVTGGVRVDDHKTYGTKVTFSANAAWRVGSGTVIRASYGEGFKAPTLYQVYGAYGKPAFDGTQALAPLQPETAKSYDIGVEQSVIDGTLKVGATAFRRDTRNQIDFVFCASTSLCSQRPSGYYDNTARTRSQGVEVFVEARPTSHLTFTANYSLIDAKNRLTGETLLRRPKHNINASIDWNAWDRVNLGASVQTVSDSNDSDFQTFMPTTLDGYTIATIRASVPIGDRFEVFGRIENLFDAKYEVVSGYGTFGRNAHVGVRVKI